MKSTTTKLFAYQFDDHGLVLLAAFVSPSDAAGTVQFKDGSANIGSPVKVIFGFAITLNKFSAGGHYVTAVFTPTGPTAFQPSTSNGVSIFVKR